MELAVLIASELKNEAVKHETAAEMFRAVAPSAHSHWMCLDKDEQFRGAVGAVLLACEEKGLEGDKAIIMKEMGMLKALAAAMSGVPVNMEAAFSFDDGFVPIGLMKIWREMDPERADPAMD